MNAQDVAYDVAVIGGGIAGTAAARDLADRGHSVVLLEGSERVGGRAFARDFAGLPGVTVDFGGSWVNTSRQPHIRREIHRYNIPLKEDLAAGAGAFLTGGKLRSTPIPIEEIGDLERAFYHVRDAAHRINPGQSITRQAVRDLDVSIDEFFAPLSLPAATRDLIYAMLNVYAGTNPGRASALNFVAQAAALGNSAVGFYSGLTERFVGGVDSLLAAMISGARLEVRLHHRVVAVERSADGVVIRNENGVVVDARTCIVAVPSNVVRHIDFRPGLDSAKQQALAENHLSRAIKILMRVRNLPPRPVALGAGGLSMVCSGREVGDGTEILYGFSNEETMDFNPRDRERVQEWLREYYPEAEVLSVDHHDWGADPLFDGTYRIDRPGEAYDFLLALNQPEDRIVFAGTDVDDSVWRTWMEGALNSSQAAVGMTSLQLARLVR